MSIKCELIPRNDLNPEQHKELANAFCYWAGPENGHESMDGYAAACMLNGEAPPTAAMGILYREILLRESPWINSARELIDEIERLRPQLARAPSHRCIRFTVMSEGYDRRQQIARLWDELPVELVNNVLIDGRSWKELDE